jgi:hypothetical protein
MQPVTVQNSEGQPLGIRDVFVAEDQEEASRSA